MKCINKMRLLCLCGIAAVFMSGCGQTVVSYDNPYDIYSTSADYGLASEGAGSEKTYFSQNLCVADDVNIGMIRLIRRWQKEQEPSILQPIP